MYSLYRVTSPAFTEGTNSVISCAYLPGKKDLTAHRMVTWQYKEMQVSLLPEAFPNVVLKTNSQALTEPVEEDLALTADTLTYKRLSDIGEL